MLHGMAQQALLASVATGPWAAPWHGHSSYSCSHVHALAISWQLCQQHIALKAPLGQNGLDALPCVRDY